MRTREAAADRTEGGRLARADTAAMAREAAMARAAREA
jgi:hypothetical protein